MGGTVIVLGAGATAGAEFSDGYSPPESASLREHCRRHPGAPWPALDGDFFEKLKHVQDDNPKHADLIARATADARWVAVGGTYPTLEGMFSYVKASERKNIGTAKINSRAPHLVRADLVKAIALQLGSALCNPHESDGNSVHYLCEHHSWLAGSNLGRDPQLDPKDVIISFNYDCLMDISLSRGANRWAAVRGYGVPVSGDVKAWTSGDAAASTEPCTQLLKMHGSLNWTLGSGGQIILTGQNYLDAESPCIVPPDWAKEDLDGEPFRTIWSKASSAFEHANSLVFIGYSMPATDLYVQALIRAARSRATHGLSTVVVVNPDDGAYHRTIQVVAKGLDAAVRFVRARSWTEFRSFPFGLWQTPNSPV